MSMGMGTHTHTRAHARTHARTNHLTPPTRLCPTRRAPGVAADLSHIDSNAKVTGHGMTLKQFKGDDAIPAEEQAAFQSKQFKEALAGCDVRVVPPFPRPRFSAFTVF